MEIDTENEIIKMEIDGFEVEIDISGVRRGIESKGDMVGAEGENLGVLRREIRKRVGVDVEPTMEKWEELLEE